jgi:hypothetical protein
MVVKIRKRASAHVTSAPLLPESTTTHSLAHSRPISEDACILRLSNELLSHIISYLRAFEIERLARTFSRRLTDACLPHLQSRIAGARNRRLMMSSFKVKDSATFLNTPIKELFHSWGLAKTHAFSAPPTDTFVNLDHFDLQGDFSWMYPTLSKDLGKMFPNDITLWPPITNDHPIDRLVSAANKLGISLPLSFRQFMGVDKDLQNRFPTSERRFLTFPHFVKLDPDVYGVGYATEFFPMSSGEGAFYLFVGDQGCTGVIRMKTWDELQYFYIFRRQTSYKWPALSALERELGVIPVPAQLAPGAPLCALDFEEFLVPLYFHLWACIAIRGGLDESPFRPPLEQFLLQTCTEEGRAQCN